jgi:hypothetical protein
MPTAAYRHHACRITDDLTYKGYRTLFLENEQLRVGVLLDKGADLFQLLHKPSDTDFLWRSPTGLLRRDRFTATRAASSGAFLDGYHGGWQEILPGGGPADYHGAELGLHGEVTHLGWDMDILEDDPERISVRLVVDCVRTPLRLERVMRLERGSPTLFFEEKITNLAPEPIDYLWGHHPAFGAPFLHQGLRLFVPAGQGRVHSPQFTSSSIFEPGAEFAWPLLDTPGGTRVDLSTVPGPQAGYADLIYLSQLEGGWYAVLDPEREIGLGLAWPLEVFPYLWFWLVYGKAPGYPWWDRAYCLALEPWTSIPNSLDEALFAHAQKTLKGGESQTAALCATAITNRKQVTCITPDGAVS